MCLLFGQSIKMMTCNILINEVLIKWFLTINSGFEKGKTHSHIVACIENYKIEIVSKEWGSDCDQFIREADNYLPSIVRYWDSTCRRQESGVKQVLDILQFKRLRIFKDRKWKMKASKWLPTWLAVSGVFEKLLMDILHYQEFVMGDLGEWFLLYSDDYDYQLKS